MAVPEKNFVNWSIDWEDQYALNNWFESLNLHCEPNILVGLFGMIYFAGYLISCAIIVPMADKNGRKIFLTIGCIIQALVFLSMILFENIYVYLLGNFLIGFTVPMKNIIGLSHLLEHLPGKESIVSGILFCWEGSIFVFSPAILLFITIDTKVFIYAAFVIAAVCSIILSVQYLPETLSYSLDKDNYD